MGNGNEEWGMVMASNGKSGILMALLQWKYLNRNGEWRVGIGIENGNGE